MFRTTQSRLSGLFRNTGWKRCKFHGSSCEALKAEFAAFMPDRISTNETVLKQHGKDESYHEAIPPDMVVYPQTTDEVARIAAACHRKRTPIIPFGIGTSLEGHVGAVNGGVCIDFSRMNSVVEINDADMDCRVEAGVTRKQLNSNLKGTGLFFPVDPGADASIGGMTATRASGTTTVKYGGMRENVIGLTVVTAEGKIMKTGSRARKSSAGYDLTRLLVGSEGTLGIITEVALKLHCLPESISSATCEFVELEDAIEAVMKVLQCAVPVARIEVLDDESITVVNSYSGTSLNPTPTLFFEFHGTESSVAEQSVLVEEIMREFRGSNFKWSTTTEERNKLWHARHNAYWAAVQYYTGCQGFLTDVCVPISHLSESIKGAREITRKLGVPSPLLGHVGDGNFHMMVMIDPNKPDEIRKAKEASEAIVKDALDLGGTCTGEHGIGRGKLKYLRQEHGSVPLEWMHAIKASLDPLGILNPGKLGSNPNNLCIEPSP